MEKQIEERLKTFIDDPNEDNIDMDISYLEAIDILESHQKLKDDYRELGDSYVAKAADIERWKEEYVKVMQSNDDLTHRLVDTEQLLKDAIYSYEKVKGAFEELADELHSIEMMLAGKWVADQNKTKRYNDAGLTNEG